jgi:hypothetical protein
MIAAALIVILAAGVGVWLHLNPTDIPQGLVRPDDKVSRASQLFDPLISASLYTNAGS